ncbi:MAG: hypothetical protein AVDCRST_MAG35-378 [uncultured Quadrisphaera sp.]|uniref:Uncharacterized protein n=1 Tax=uncultured Quadrisphaera sp. TaxID=904978 RepID=A0A6J4NSL3_9ACTN|nr:MAG: hypothetical protein AVDCRST_MAG35-378 [uncultured Quadrisphaera sp.]
MRRRGRAARWGPPARATADLVRRTFAVCLRWRVTGLAAEASFFTLLSLPGLALSLAAAAAAVGRAAGPDATAELTRGVLETSSRFVTPDVVRDVVAPTLDDALSTTRADLISLGLLFALWSGSRAVHVFVDAITIMYGLGGLRGLALARLQSMLLHLVSLVVAVVGLPLLVLGPPLAERLLPDRLDGLTRVLWPVAVLVATALVATLYHVATPVRSPWRRDVPGAAAAVLVWLAASALLRVVVGESFARGASVYGPLTTAIVVMGWLYLLAVAVLVGAALNAAIDERWPLPARERARALRPGAAAPVGRAA